MSTNFSFDLGGAPDFPHGKATHGGWWCRSCGDDIVVGNDIWKPNGVWVCDACYQAKRWTSTPGVRGRNANYQQHSYDYQQRREHAQAKPEAPKSDLELVDEDNWIEIIFEVIPDRHVKRVFASLAKVYHPDVGGTDEDMRRINAAYAARQHERV